MELASTSCTAEQQRFVLEARRTLLDELLAALMEQVSLLALSGPPGVGKTTIASALEQELGAQAIDVFRVGCGERGRIDLRALTCQLLDKPESEFTADDVEGVFGLLSSEGNSGQRRVLVIDGAEQIRGDALGYLDLLSSIVGDAMPQIVFVGRPSFLEASDEAATKDLRARIAFRRDLAPLTEDEAGRFIDLSASPRTLRPEVRASLIRQADGSIERLAGLLTLTELIRKEKRRRRANESTVELAVARMDTIAQLATAAGGLASESEPAPIPGPEEDVRRRPAFARTSILVGVAVLLIVSLGSWQTGEKGVHLSTLAASLEGRDAKVTTLSAPAAIGAVEDHPQMPDPPSPAPVSGTMVAATGDHPATAEVSQSHSAPTSGDVSRPAGDGAGAHDASSPAKSSDPRQDPSPTVDASAPPEASGEEAGGNQETHHETAANEVQLAPAPAAPSAAVSHLALADTVPLVPAVPTPPPANLGPIVSRGDDLLALGDIIGARLYYERAAALGSATAETSLGMTYDPAFLSAIRASGVLPDPDRAASWYRKAIASGDGKAKVLLARLTEKSGSR